MGMQQDCGSLVPGVQRVFSAPILKVVAVIAVSDIRKLHDCDWCCFSSSERPLDHMNSDATATATETGVKDVKANTLKKRMPCLQALMLGGAQATGQVKALHLTMLVLP